MFAFLGHFAVFEGKCLLKIFSKGTFVKKVFIGEEGVYSYSVPYTIRNNVWNGEFCFKGQICNVFLVNRFAIDYLFF